MKTKREFQILVAVIFTFGCALNTYQVGGIENYTLVGTDPQGDVLGGWERPYCDLKEAYMAHNDTLLFLKVVVWGDIKDTEKILYVWSFKSNKTLGDEPLNVGAIYRNGSAEFWDKTICSNHIQETLYLEIPLKYMYEEGCVNGTKIDIASIHIYSSEWCPENNVSPFGPVDSIDNYVVTSYYLEKPVSKQNILVMLLVGVAIVSAIIVTIFLYTRRKKMYKKSYN
jgi:hypothetical protein